jgi:hypothetical protein
MSGIKYVGMDVHQATAVVPVLNGHGKLVQRSVIETKAASLRDFVRGLSGGNPARLPDSRWESPDHLSEPSVAQKRLVAVIAAGCCSAA